MVARTPLKQKRVVAPLNPLLLGETLKKVDKCMARLQEMQYTVAGGNKVISGVSLSPRSTRGYLKTSLRCKQESMRIKSSTGKSPNGKFPTNTGEWKKMSLPAMLVGETVGEILQATQFARDIVAAVSNKTRKTTLEDPKTPETEQRKQRPNLENLELRSRRKREKQHKLQSIRSESSNSPSLQRARSRINFKVVSPLKVKDLEKESTKLMASRVSPRNKPWTKKTVLFPNPLFQSTQYTQQQRFCKTRSPVILRNKGTPHKFLIKSPAKFQVKKIKSPPAKVISPKMSSASKLRRSFSPSRLANRLMSPLKSRRMSLDKGGSMSGLKQRPQAMPMRFSIGRMQGL